MSELELFDHLVSMNPVMGPTKDAIVKGTHKKHRYLMPKWMTGRSDDFYSGQPTTYLATLGIPLQIWYDIVYLGLRSINDRPKCSVCKENYLPFCGTRGYALVCSKKCHKETISKANKGKKNSEIHNKRISESHKGVPLSADHRASISRARRSPDNPLRGVPLSEEHRLKISKSKKGLKFTEDHKKSLSDAKKISTYTPSEETRRKMSESNKGKVVSEETRDKLSLLRLRMIIQGRNPQGNRYYKRGWILSSKMTSSIYYMSSYEKLLLEAMEFDPTVVSIRAAASELKIRYKGVDGKFHRYGPDFLVDCTDGETYLIEVKPRFELDDETTKLKESAALKVCKEMGYHYRFITESELDKLKSGKDLLTIIKN